MVCHTRVFLYHIHDMRKSRKNSVTRVLFSHQRILQMAVRTSLPKGFKCFSTLGGSVPVFLRIPIATCDFLGGGGASGPHCPSLHYRSAHVICRETSMPQVWKNESIDLLSLSVDKFQFLKVNGLKSKLCFV